MIDRIVAGVLEQLRSAAAAPPQPTGSANSAPSHSSPGKAVEIRDGVITGTLLEERGVISGPVVFGPKSVLTPSALDFLATRKIDWRRADPTAAAAGPRRKMAGDRHAVDAGRRGGARPRRQRRGSRLEPRADRLPS